MAHKEKPSLHQQMPRSTNRWLKMLTEAYIQACVFADLCRFESSLACGAAWGEDEAVDLLSSRLRSWSAGRCQLIAYL